MHCHSGITDAHSQKKKEELQKKITIEHIIIFGSSSAINLAIPTPDSLSSHLQA
jgi:hypothetical protein